MPRKKTAPDELEAILQAIARHPQGVGAARLHQELGTKLSQRTLKRRLSQLVQEGRLHRKGQARATVYHLPSLSEKASSQRRLISRDEHIVSDQASEAGSDEAIVPLSPAGKETLAYVQQPTGKRRPISYQREFLDDYEPNQTAYLPEVTRSHLHHIGKTPGEHRPAGTYARQILDRLLIDLSWASSRLEGNTYSRLDTERLIGYGEYAEGKDAQETQMILNHKAAIEFLVSDAEELGFNNYTFLNLHSLLSENLLTNPDAAGRIREIPVSIQGSVYHPLAVPQMIEECFGQLLDKAAAVDDPFEQAFFVMVHIPYLQPFEDVNKRVSRLGANLSLIRENLVPISFVDVPQRDYIEGTLGVYELNQVELLRDLFVWAYERPSQQYVAAVQSLGEPDPFRLRYRRHLAEVVGKIVGERLTASEGEVANYASLHIEETDREPFVELALQELDRLHEGNIARYRLRPSQFRAWRKASERP